MKFIIAFCILISSVSTMFGSIIEFENEFYSYRTVCFDDNAKIEIYRIEDISANIKTLNEDSSPNLKGYEECVQNKKNIKTKKLTSDEILKIISDNEAFWND